VSQTVAVIIVAAGRGHRLGGETPKQYLPLEGACALRRSVEAFLVADAVSSLRVVIHPDDQALYERAMAGLNDARVLDPVPGGATRAGSVHEGLEAFAADSPDVVLIHDAARPFLPQSVIGAVLEALESCDGACAALPLVDALWASEDGHATTPLARDGHWRAQTPQGFGFAKILAAHRAHDGSGADDVAVACEAGLAVRFVPGAEGNYKITTQSDLDRARRALKRP
jgi:2-C-methyl-D-erythritol 4-phosphate cytidylyltransferase